MNKPEEVKRIVGVYRDYQSDGETEARWGLENPGNRCEWDRRRSLVLQLLTQNGLTPLSDKKLLDIGCGKGSVMADFNELGIPASQLFGIDLLSHRIDEAMVAHPEMNFACGNAQALEFPDKEFDIVLLFTVLSSILDEQMSQDIAQEVTRVLKPGGAVVIYEFRYNNPRNQNTKAMKRSDFQRLFPDPAFRLDVQTTTLLPPVGRRLGRATNLLYPLLSLIPFLRSHFVAVATKSRDQCVSD